MNIADIRDSSLLERYLIQDLTDEEHVMVSGYLTKFPELKDELSEIETALETYAMASAIDPPQAVKPMLMSALNYIDRLEAGELPTIVPGLTDNSKIEDFEKWLIRPDLQEASEYESMSAHIIGKNEERSTAIVWLKHGAPPEIHSHEMETFFILEGTCDITIDETAYSLKAGDFLEIPLHVSHHVKVTSAERCKLILERSAA